MAKALVTVYDAPYAIAGVTGKVAVNIAVAVDDGVHHYEDGFTVDFSLSAAANIAALKTAVVNGVSSRGGPALLTTDVILWGAVS